MSFTIIGGRGFVGGAVASRLRRDGQEVWVPERDDSEILKKSLGHVIYAAGVTADFRSRCFDTLQAHVGCLSALLEKATFESFLYLSSCRLYRHADHSRENAPIAVCSEEPEDFYDLTKLTGEALCHASGRSAVRVVRLSNVIGPDFSSANFVFELIRSACQSGHITLRSALDSEKDYVLLSDVAKIIPRIALSGRERCYNIASGRNLSHSQVLGAIAEQTGASFDVVSDAQRVVTPIIDIQRVRDEFGYVPQDVLSEIANLVNEYRKCTNAENRS